MLLEKIVWEIYGKCLIGKKIICIGNDKYLPASFVWASTVRKKELNKGTSPLKLPTKLNNHYSHPFVYVVAWLKGRKSARKIA